MAKNHRNNEEISHTLKINITQAIRCVTAVIKAKRVPMIHGSPAIGKSGIVHQIAADYNLLLIDLRLSQCDPPDLLGFPQINAVLQRAGYVPMDTFPIEGEELPINPETNKAYAGWLLFLDEFNSASVAVQAASYKIVLDRMVGKHHLHKNVAVVCAGNLESDGAIVEQMSTALQSRIVHFDLEVDHEIWIKWATQKGFDHRITSFINFKPGMLYTFKPDHSDRTYAAPRTWEFANDFMKNMAIDDPDMLPILSGTITQGVTREFINFCQIFDKLPTIADIVMAPNQITVPNEPSILFALTGSIAHHANDTTLGPLMEFVLRLPAEFQIICMRQMMVRNSKLVTNKDVQKWLAINANEFIS